MSKPTLPIGKSLLIDTLDCAFSGRRELLAEKPRTR
jgi:hypothetical protein